MLSSQQIIDFQDQGFLVLPGLASSQYCEAVIAFAEQQLLQPVLPVEFEADTGYPGAPVSQDAEGGRTVRRLLQAYARSSLLADWADGQVLTAPLKQLLGEGARMSQAHHNCIMTKQARYSSVTGWHRDSRYWNFQKAELISAWLALRDEVVENGCLWAIPASHNDVVQAEQLDAAQFLREDLPQNTSLLKRAFAVPLQQGDVLLFHSNLFHAAGKNHTDATKFSMVFTYRAADNLPVAGSRSASLAEILL